jgi:DeoR/GlpR family transcriptional regulator of sugar metabolism
LLSKIRADICILGICGVHQGIGMTIPDWGEAVVKRKMVAISKQVIALVTSDKLNTAESYIVCSFDELDVMLVDNTIDATELQRYKELGLTIL